MSGPTTRLRASANGVGKGASPYPAEALFVAPNLRFDASNKHEQRVRCAWGAASPRVSLLFLARDSVGGHAEAHLPRGGGPGTGASAKQISGDHLPGGA